MADLPGVGQNLQDKWFVTVSNEIAAPNPVALINDPAQKDEVLHQYLEEQRGPLSSAGGYLAFEKLPSSYRRSLSKRTRDLLATLPADWPEIEWITGGFLNGQGGTTGSLSPAILAPFSRGNVTISSAKMTDSPVFDLGWLNDPADAELALAAFKRTRRDGWGGAAIRPIKVGPELTPGPEVATDGQILEYIRKTANQLWHASSTCAMGKNGEERKGAVVDSSGRVLGGVSGLRVLDASVFPFALPTHPTATLYALAEKIADGILRTK